MIDECALQLEHAIAHDPVKGAILSPRIGERPPQFRFVLWRRWDSALPDLAVVMLNPSTADARTDDHTIRVVVGFAMRNGYGAIYVVNLFAYRATDPFDLLKFGLASAVGPDNDKWIGAVCRDRDVLVAWGNGSSHRTPAVVEIITPIAAKILSLGVNRDGSPPHPARLAGATKMVPWGPVKTIAQLKETLE